MPNLYIITGSNGAGKSTVGPEYLPKVIHSSYPVFDGDLLYTKKLNELFPNITRSAKYARRDALDYVIELFEQQTEAALAKGEDYAYEGHFTNNETWEKPKQFKSSGYHIHLIFFGLNNPELSQFRVTERVTEGGHYVDPQTLRDNFYGNLQKLNIHHGLIDDLTIVDTSAINHKVLFKTIDHQVAYHTSIEELPDWFIDYLPNVVQLFS
ncbi:zeta toxin family protein [uncultured Mucilaginibacter sp.]|uniref:zeta toxin family protein n=1 Tax=uncultured Mucilaginibacter sp. TaxID=797541 RepID=UPI0026362A19|nr:zeta toxin family protein [uncultured Mucilaginibacter sp.]